jgi:hypothetical protein
MTTKIGKFTVLAGAAALLLGACATSPGGPTAGSTVQLQADYPTYDQATLVQEATLIVEGEVVATEPTVLTPRYEGDTPQENPLLGLSEDEQKKALEDADGVPATAVTFRADVVHHGTVTPGQEILVVQTGGTIDGVDYVLEGEVMLTPGENYLLFATDSFDGAYAILGGSAGTFRSTGKDTFTAVAPEVTPFAELDTTQVAQLID